MDTNFEITQEQLDSLFSRVFTKQQFNEEKCECTLLEANGDHLVFALYDFDKQNAPYCKGVLYNSKEYNIRPVSFEEKEDRTICTFSLPDFSEGVKDFTVKRWKVRLVCNDGSDFCIVRLHETGFKSIKGRRSHLEYFPKQWTAVQEFPVEADTETDETMVAIPYMTIYGNWCIVQCREKNKYSMQLNTKATAFSMRNGILKLRFVTALTDKDWKGLYIDYSARLAEEKKKFFVPAEKITHQGDQVVLDFTIDLRSYPFEPLQWYFRPVFEENGQLYHVGYACNKKLFTAKLTKLFQDNRILMDNGLILFPYMTNGDAIALMCREKNDFDGIGFRIKERAALLAHLVMKNRLDSQNVLIVYEKYCQMAQDNGYYFFKYCMDHDIEQKSGRKIYYVIDKKSPDYAKLAQYDKNVLQFMSLKFMVNMVAAKLLVSSDSKVHAYVWRPRPSLIRPILETKKTVFLQHGVTAFKKVDNIYRKSGKNSCELFVVTSEAEKEIVKNNFNYNEDEIALTGFARWDVLHDHSEGNRKILLMPTWRNWLDDTTEEMFTKSEYYEKYMSLLNSRRLHALLKENDAEMVFYIHPKFRQYIENFNCESDRIQIVPFGSTPLNELMMECNLLITDYSSVAWDVFYQGKPVLFYQFDIEKYMEAHGSYIDMETELFGDRAMEADELVGLIEKNIKNGFALDPEYKDMLSQYFSFIDDNNSQRIYECIEAKGL